MEEQFWVIKCKVCGNVHAGVPTMPGPGMYLAEEFPIQGYVECPDHPGKCEEYQGSEWTALTKSELDSLLKK